MKKQYKYGIAIVAIALLLLTFRKQIFGQNELGEDIGFPLKMGSRGNDVKVLQRHLNAKYGKSLVVDGIFGILTETVLHQSYGVKEVSKKLYNNLK